MYNWKAINRDIREQIEKDGYDYFGANSISYDDNYAHIMYSSTGDDIYLKLEYNPTNEENKILLCEDVNASEINKEKFNTIIQNINIEEIEINENEIVQTNDGRETCLYTDNAANDDFYIKHSIQIIENIWKKILDKNTHEETKNLLHETQKNTIKEKFIENSNVKEKINKNSSFTLIRLIRKETTSEQSRLFFELSDDKLHNFEVLLTNENGTTIANIKARNEFSYCLETKSRTKFVINENGKKLYQTSMVGKIDRSIQAEPKIEKILPKEEVKQENKHLDVISNDDVKDDVPIENEPILIQADFIINLEDISLEATKFYQ